MISDSQRPRLHLKVQAEAGRVSSVVQFMRTTAMNLRGASVRIGLWFACFLVVPASSAPAQVIGLVIDDTQAYVARLRRTGYAVWQVTLERGERDDFVRTLSSSDVPTTCPLVRVHESPTGVFLFRRNPAGNQLVLE